jgi:MoaA/NifB/PqqE/SkfB family radical SAM enzyme
MNLKHKIKSLIRAYFPTWLNKLIFNTAFRINKFFSIRKRKLLKFEFHLTDHCNLNCVACTHFCPLVKEQFLSLSSYENDIKRLAFLAKGKVEKITFMGGEPLLHNDLIKFFSLSRQYFPHTDFDLITNAILLPKQNENFWKACYQYKIKIYVSEYPVKIDYKLINELAKKYKVKVILRGKGERLQWRKIKLDINGKQSITDSFKACNLSNYCINLYEGKLYPCPIIPYIHYFNEYFHQNYETTNQDYIDIYKTENIQTIIDFLSKPVPFCKYCDIKNSQNIEWEISKKDITEWT